MVLNKIIKGFSSFTTDRQNITKEEIAEILRVSPEALDAFEAAYTKYVLEQEPSDFFEINSKQAAKNKHSIDILEPTIEIITDAVIEFERRIVEELLSKTEIYSFNGKIVEERPVKALPAEAKLVQNSDINQLPEHMRPQLTGNLMKVDINEPSYPQLLWFYKESLEGNNQKKRKQAYNMFRQGLDILDLDPIIYEIIGTNPISMGNWLPQLVKACSAQSFFKIPATTIVKVPMTLLQLTRQDYQSLTQTTLDIVNQWAYKAFALNNNNEYFIKTGTYSSKFDFRNAYVHGEKEVKELGEYLLYIHYQALQMASPLCKPSIYGVSTTNEWVVREFIHDKENNPCIYKGLPLHTEYRVFVDCDTKRIIGIAPYWEPETMKQRFGHEKDADSPHQIHDYVIYKSHEKTLMQRYHENKDVVQVHIQDVLENLELKGQWSIDIMQNGEDFWIIDMALAENSAFYNCVPEHLRKLSEENWIPKLLDLK